MVQEKLNRTQDWGPTVVRAAVGFTFLMYGWQKLFVLGIDGVTGYFAQLGVPAAPLAAVCVTAFELVGGAALLLGLFTRPVAAVFAAEMLVAIPLVHLANGFFVADGGYGHALLTLAASATLVLTGAGALAPNRALSGLGEAGKPTSERPRSTATTP